MPEGGTVRVREGEALILQLVGLNAQRELITVVANQLAAVGIETEASFMSNIDALQTVLADGNFDVALVDVVPSYDPDLYDFWSQEAMIRGQNYGQWNNQRASEALEGGRQLWRVEERLPFYDAFLRIYNVELPAITLYQHLSTYVITTDVKLADIGLHYQPRDRYRNFDEWFLHFKDIPIPCPTTIE
jgi:ABC-type transport system substrate-binding protein